MVGEIAALHWHHLQNATKPCVTHAVIKEKPHCRGPLTAGPAFLVL